MADGLALASRKSSTAPSSRSVPFVFLTGYDSSTVVPDGLRATRRLGKPMLEHQLIDALGDLLTH